MVSVGQGRLAFCLSLMQILALSFVGLSECAVQENAAGRLFRRDAETIFLFLLVWFFELLEVGYEDYFDYDYGNNEQQEAAC